MLKVLRVTGIELRDYGNSASPFRVTFDAKDVTLIISVNKEEVKQFHLGEMYDMEIAGVEFAKVVVDDVNRRS